VHGKGRKQRRVPVHARARRALNEYLEERDEPASDEPLFLSQKGGAISSYAVWYTVKKYATLAEVELDTTARYSQPSAEDMEKAAKRLE
jgi:site-specific recombinase XerD